MVFFCSGILVVLFGILGSQGVTIHCFCRVLISDSSGLTCDLSVPCVDSLMC